MIPKYMQVYTEIKDTIQKGSYSANEMLPSGEEFAKQYACSVSVSYTHLLESLVFAKRAADNITVCRKGKKAYESNYDAACC